MPQTHQQSKKSNSRANPPAISSRARPHKGIQTGAKKEPAKNGAVRGKRRATRTVEMKRVGAAPRIMRRPKPRRRPLTVTAQFGAVSPRRIKRRSGIKELGRKTRRRVETVKVRGARLPWSIIATAVCCTAVIMAMVLGYVRLNELTNQYQSMQEQTVQLSADRKRLTLLLEQKNDLLSIEEQAEEAGMVKSDRVEKRYIRLETEDKIVVPEKEDSAISRFFTGIADWFRNIFE